MSEYEIDHKILGIDTSEDARKHFIDAIDAGIQFKQQQNVRNGSIDTISTDELIDDLPLEGIPLEDVFEDFQNRFMSQSYNFASPNFMGFPDAGNSIAAIQGNILADFMQQNMINQSFCSPTGTFAEISAIRWLREVVGYDNPEKIEDIFDVGGMMTGGGTTSNAVGIMLARENFDPNAMTEGVDPSKGYKVIVPRGIGHYSVKSAQMWVGAGNNLVEVDTDNFRFDIEKLKRAIGENEGQIMALVAYAGDSRTMSVDHFDDIADVVEGSGQNIWTHADACHGFSLGFSERLKYKISGIERFDSITTDPHKVMNIPYTLSALLVREPRKVETIASLSDLIMQEQFAFGQTTPFIGSKPWASLKLWFAMKHIGKRGYGEIIDRRHDLALKLEEMVTRDEDFASINNVDINSVAFMYTGNMEGKNIDKINELNKAIHKRIIEEGIFHLHQFSIPDSGVFEKDTILYPLRFMSGNPNTKPQNLREMLSYVRKLGEEERIRLGY